MYGLIRRVHAYPVCIKNTTTATTSITTTTSSTTNGSMRGGGSSSMSNRNSNHNLMHARSISVADVHKIQELMNGKYIDSLVHLLLGAHACMYVCM